MKSSSDVESLLRRILKAGPMRRLPKNRQDTDTFLALAASVLDPQATYSETDLNELLIEWMSPFIDPVSLDHVTVRRYMVDASMLLRDAEGNHYRANQVIINRVILPEARTLRPDEVLATLQTERAARRKAAVKS